LLNFLPDRGLGPETTVALVNGRNRPLTRCSTASARGWSAMNRCDQDKYNEGLQKIIERGKMKFRITENLEYYSEKDFKAAEKKYLKLCVIGGRC
jgi:hypothetical protein